MSTELSKDKYIETVGRRKTSSARVRVWEAAKNSVLINDRELNEYFPVKELQEKVLDPITKVKVPAKYKITVLVKGGGMNSQAEAVRHGIARALVESEPELRKSLKAEGFLKRDPRAVERKKFGLKKARKSPQWSKR